MPDIEGIETFQGKVIHTTKWDDTYDLAGKRAAVIGTGATAVQLIPEVAKQVSDLTVYQRTAIWVSAKPDYRIPRVAAGGVLAAAPDPAGRAARRHGDPRGDDGLGSPALQGGPGGQPDLRAGVPGAPSPPGQGPAATAQAHPRLHLRLQAADVLQRLLPDLQQAARAPGDDPHRADRRVRHRHLRWQPHRHRRTPAGDRLQPVGRELPGDRDHRQGGTQPGQVVARHQVPGLRGHRRPEVPELRVAELARTPTAGCPTSPPSSPRCVTWTGSSPRCTSGAPRRSR